MLRVSTFYDHYLAISTAFLKKGKVQYRWTDNGRKLSKHSVVSI